MSVGRVLFVSFALCLLAEAPASSQETVGDVADKLVINEIQVANIDQYIDNSYNYGGWIELYNPTEDNIPVRGMYIADGVEQCRLLSTQGYVPAGGYKIFWFDHNSRDGNFGSKASLQIPFKLNCEGGTISLLSSDMDTISSVAYPEMFPRCSFARIGDAAEEWGFTGEPTPGSSNAGSKFATERLAAPKVSNDSHLFSKNFTVRVTIPRGTTLRYTTDGSTPTISHGETSTNGIFPISKTTILRLCLVADGYLPGPVVTRSYIYKNHDYYLPVLSVVTDPKNLYDNTIGIYTKGTNGISGNGQSSACNWNMDWERPVNMEYLVPNVSASGSVTYRPQVNQELDMEISGGWTRAYGGGTVDGKNWPMKSSFRLKTDKRYEGVNTIDYPVFPDKPYNKYRCWQVRNGGNDTYARIIDPALQQIVMKSGFYVDCQDYQPAHVFFNGEYVGMFNIRESNNRHYGYSNYGIDTDDMDQFDLSDAKYNQKVGDNQAWRELVRLAMQLSSTKKPELYDDICSRLDMDEYINYMALECYIGPSDWITNTNNVKGFRSRSDGKFHFVLFDLDSAFGSDNMLSQVIATSGGSNVDDLFRYLMKYAPFRRQFVDAYCLVDGSIFEPDRCEKIIRGIYDNTNIALSFEGNASNLGLTGTIRSAYNGSRIENMRRYMGLGKGIYLTLSSNINEARLLVNGQEVPTGRFAGYLFPYDGNPVTLTAKAPVGYRFDGWMSVDQIQSSSAVFGEGSDWEYYDQGSMDAYSWKSAAFDGKRYGWKSGKAPFGYAADGQYMSVNAATRLDYGSNSNDKRPTYYFRKTFDLSSIPEEDRSLVLHYQVDDGMMLYVNGHEVGGYYVDSGSPYNSYTSGGHFEASTPYSGTMAIPNEYLHEGTNLIAVEVKNTSAVSTDIYFEASLVLKTNDMELCSADESVDITRLFDEETKHVLKARFVPVTDMTARLEAGAAPVRINEVSADNDIYINEYGKKSDWVELYNTTDEDINLEGLYLSDNSRKPQKFRLEKGVIPAHGRCIVWCDGRPSLGQLHAPFKLENADGACVTIQAGDGTWADRMDYSAQGRWQTYGRYPDGGNMATLMNQPTIDRTNKLGMFDFTSITDEWWQGSDIAITLSLAEGWNWTSHNLAMPVDRSRFTTYAEVIRGEYEEYSASHTNDELEALEPALGYKLKMKDNADITLRGAMFDASVPVSLRKGWNWIGFPLYNATTIEAALAEYSPEKGDRIVGLDAFAVYGDDGWRGSLASFTPGQSYLFYVTDEQTFCWHSLSPMRLRQRRYEAPGQSEDNAWQLDIHAYPDVMTLVAEVNAGEGVSLDGDCYVGAFCEDECRGVGVWDDGLLFMNIHGEDAERITFRLLDASGECYGSPQTLTFRPQDMPGSCDAPYAIGFYTDAMLDEITPAPASGKTAVDVRYYNMAGQRVANPLSGVYVRRTVHSDGSVSSVKVALP